MKISKFAVFYIAAALATLVHAECDISVEVKTTATDLPGLYTQVTSLSGEGLETDGAYRFILCRGDGYIFATASRKAVR